LAEESRTVLEVGTAWGYSTILMALAGATVWSVDPHDYYDSWDAFQRAIDLYRVRSRVIAIRASSHATLPAMLAEGTRFDGAFIDGDHSYHGCRHDLLGALKLVREGGWIACHDYSFVWQGVWKAANEVLGETTNRRVVESLLVVRLGSDAS
jgi:predicted O-methyltransferase YrrM